MSRAVQLPKGPACETHFLPQFPVALLFSFGPAKRKARDDLIPIPSLSGTSKANGSGLFRVVGGYKQDVWTPHTPPPPSGGPQGGDGREAERSRANTALLVGPSGPISCYFCHSRPGFGTLGVSRYKENKKNKN